MANGKTGVRITGSLAEAIRKHSLDLQTKVFRSAAHAGALAFYEELKLRTPVDSGKLKDSIYRWHDTKVSTNLFQRYKIGPNVKKAPHWHNVEYGHWRYNAAGADGFWQKSKSKKSAKVATPGVMDRSVHDLPGALDAPVWVPESPYLRPAYHAAAAKAITAAKQRAKERLAELSSGATDGD